LFLFHPFPSFSSNFCTACSFHVSMFPMSSP
jgi:hypothetical protein